MASFKTRISGSELRSWVALAATAGLFIGILAGPVMATEPTNGNPSEHTISVSGSGKVLLTPDIADVSLGVTIQRDKVSTARDEAAAVMAAVVAALHTGANHERLLVAIERVYEEIYGLDVTPS